MDSNQAYLRGLLIVAFATLLSSCLYKTETLYIGSAPSSEIGPKQRSCLLSKSSPTEEYSTLCDSIKGFKYQEGYFYTIKVRLPKIQIISKFNTGYSLVKVISKTMDSTATINGTWRVKSMEGCSYDNGPSLTINIGEHRYNGRAFCNSYKGAFSTNGDTITFHKERTTRMACPNLDEEELFLQSLLQVGRYSFEAGSLMLYSKENELLLVCIKESH